MADIELQISRIREIYRAIDTTYQTIQRHYGFDCTGCQTNCCATRFYHYTHSEAIYLRMGFDHLPEDLKQESLHRAVQYENFYSNGYDYRPFFCPLNINNLCILYDWRPMICRLHGLPYELQDINNNPTFHGGCVRFMAQDMGSIPPYMSLNRTIFYREMAKVESAIRDILGLEPPPPRTVAAILLKKDG
jgi:Fe-S-cluster containining protein